MLRVIGGAGHGVIGRAAPLGKGRPPGLALAGCPRGRQRLQVKRDFACTFTRHFSPVLVVLPATVTLGWRGRPRTLARRVPRPGARQHLRGVSGGIAASFWPWRARGGGAGL